MPGTDTVAVISCMRVADAPADYLHDKYKQTGSRYVPIPCPMCESLMYVGARASLLILTDAAKALCTHCFQSLREFTERRAQ